MKKLLLLLIILAARNSLAQAPNWLWATHGGGSQVEYSHSVTTDPAGNVYITGSFVGTAQFSGNTLVSQGMADMFVAKYDSLGTLLWIRHGGGSQVDEGINISADAAGNCYVSGVFSDTVVFDGDTLIGTNAFDLFFARYDSSGTLSWLKKIGNRSYAGGITTDNDGHVFLAGRFEGTGIFDTTSLTSYGGSDAFLAQFDSNGSVQWARKAGSGGNDQNFGSATDTSGNTYLVGEFINTATFGGFQLTSVGQYGNVYVVKYDHNGTALWVNRGSSTDVIFSYSIGADPGGNCFVSGMFRDTASFDTLSLINPSATALNVFVARFDSSGQATWMNRAYCSNFIDSRSLAVDANGDCYIAGHFAGTATFGTLSMFSTLGFADVFVVKYDAGGSTEWIQKGGGNAGESNGVIALDADGNVYETGTYSSSSSLFGTHAIPAPAGSADVFLAKLGSTLAVGIQEPGKPARLQCYPNPAGEVLHVYMPQHSNPFLEIVDPMGRRMSGYILSPGFNTIDVSLLGQGLYILRTSEGSLLFLKN